MHISSPRRFKHQNSPRRPPEREERVKFPTGEGKKTRNFGNPHPFVPHPSRPHPSGPIFSGFGPKPFGVFFCVFFASPEGMRQKKAKTFNAPDLANMESVGQSRRSPSSSTLMSTLINEADCFEECPTTSAVNSLRDARHGLRGVRVIEEVFGQSGNQGSCDGFWRISLKNRSCCLTASPLCQTVLLVRVHESELELSEFHRNWMRLSLFMKKLSAKTTFIKIHFPNLNKTPEPLNPVGLNKCGFTPCDILAFFWALPLHGPSIMSRTMAISKAKETIVEKKDKTRNKAIKGGTNNIVRVFAETSPAVGQRRFHKNTAYARSRELCRRPGRHVWGSLLSARASRRGFTRQPRSPNVHI